MSQEQPRRDHREEAVKYGDVFSNVHGQLANQPVAPMDAAMMQAAETALLGQTQKGGAAAAMQSAATRNENAGVVEHNDMTGDVVGGGLSITETSDLPGEHVISKSVGGQVVETQNQEEKERKICNLVKVVEEYSQRVPMQGTMTMAPPTLVEHVGSGGVITIGEALEATAFTAGSKPVEWSDAAAIQAAEVRATGRTNIVPGGVAAAAQSAATLNARATRKEDKTKLADILMDATSKLPADKPATRRDAEGVTGAEMRNDPDLTTHPKGVAASVAAAARLNQATNSTGSNINNN